jgi:TetR/AcrR family transcriptional regulator, transcriptional repressor for nem operon
MNGPVRASRPPDRLTPLGAGTILPRIRPPPSATPESATPWLQGCPLNNLAQEMSPLDEGFHTRIDRLYTIWRKSFAAALANGVAAGTVKKTIVPRAVAAMLVAGQMGIWGTGKSSRNKQMMTQAADAICDYLDSLKP